MKSATGSARGYLLIGGSLWDLRQDVGQSVTDKLFIEALGLEAVYFDQFLYDVLLEDRIIYGDGWAAWPDKASPHYDAILYAFENHTIYPNDPDDYCAPSAPKNLRWSSNGWGSNPVIEWDLNTEPDFDHNILYISYTNESGTTYSTIDPATSPYTDYNMTIDRFWNTTATYEVTANDEYNESNPSNQILIKGDGPMWKQFSENNSESLIPETFQISQNTPNPFNPTTLIKFGLPEEAFVMIKIFDLQGKEIKTLFNNNMEAGYKSILWDGKNQNGNPVSSGIYFLKIDAISKESDDYFHGARKMMLLR